MAKNFFQRFVDGVGDFIQRIFTRAGDVVETPDPYLEEELPTPPEPAEGNVIFEDLTGVASFDIDRFTNLRADIPEAPFQVEVIIEIRKDGIFDRTETVVRDVDDEDEFMKIYYAACREGLNRGDSGDGAITTSVTIIQ